LSDHFFFMLVSALMGSLTGYALFHLGSFWLGVTIFLFWLALLILEVEDLNRLEMVDRDYRKDWIVV